MEVSVSRVINILRLYTLIRYPEILVMETNIFSRYSTEEVVQSAMSQAFEDIAYGQLPHSSIVLSSLFKRFVGPTHSS